MPWILSTSIKVGRGKSELADCYRAIRGGVQTESAISIIFAIGNLDFCRYFFGK